MKQYISDEDSGDRVSISIELGNELGPVDIVRILGDIRGSLTPQLYGIKKGGSISSDFRIRDNKLFFCCCDGNFYCLDTKTGSEIWSYLTSNSVWSSPAVVNGVIYVNSHDTAYALNAATGKQIWNFYA